MTETQHENELRLLLKALKVNYNGTSMSGSNAFSALTIDYDILGNDYMIDWNTIPVTVKILKNI